MGTHRLVPGDARAVAEDNFERPFQFVVVDLRTGLATPLVDAPAGVTLGYIAATRAIWLADNRHAILCNTFLPLAGTAGAERARRAAGPAIAVVDATTRSLRAVKPLAVRIMRDPQRYYVDEVSWDPVREEMTLTYLVPSPAPSTQARPPQTFALHGDEWIPRPPAAPRGPGNAVELAVEEAFDRPPALTGRPRGETASTIVWDPNPQLAELALGRVSLYRWQAKDGTSWAGILALPPDYDSRRRYPLVIQTHGYRADKYFVEGMYPTGSGGRALAARGVVVLQMDMPTLHLQTAPDAAFHLAGFQAAVARLSADGLIDPHRVGVIGFSYTCYYTMFALANDPGLFAAAAITDGFNLGYWQYLLGSDGEEIFQEVNGGKPWGAGQASWLARSPELNLDKIRAPLLVSALEQGTLPSEWEPYAGLLRLGKPVDMLWLRRENATHIVFRPWHQQVSEQSAVDWFDFWLNGREDPAATDPADPANRANPARLSQYARWRELRKLLPAGAPAAPAGRR
jgi:Prolyl oligopeptidase family